MATFLTVLLAHISLQGSIVHHIQLHRQVPWREFYSPMPQNQNSTSYLHVFISKMSLEAWIKVYCMRIYWFYRLVFTRFCRLIGDFTYVCHFWIEISFLDHLHCEIYSSLRVHSHFACRLASWALKMLGNGLAIASMVSCSVYVNMDWTWLRWWEGPLHESLLV